MFIHEVQTPPKPAPDNQPAQGELWVGWSLLWRSLKLPIMLVMIFIGFGAMLGVVMLPIFAFKCWLSGDSTKTGWLALAWLIICALFYAVRRFIGPSLRASNPNP